MHYYCTLFDSNYIHKGLALYNSLSSVSNNFHIFIVAFDDQCYKILFDLNLPHLTVVTQSQVETEELLNVKSTRNRAEYCWTTGPTMIYYFITKYNLDHCTYVDADLMFFSSPDPIYSEIGNNSVAITDHFSEEIDEVGGRYCVQFVYFKNDENGMAALTWWKNECINWCYARFEDGKYGDQKYLDYFPKKFNNVKVLEHRGAGVAQWNAFQYDFSDYGFIYQKSVKYNIIFYHFHGTRIEMEDKGLTLNAVTYDISPEMEKNVYLPYLNLIKTIYSDYLNVNISSVKVEKRHKIRQLYSLIKKKLRKNKVAQFIYYKIFKVKYNGYEQNK